MKAVELAHRGVELDKSHIYMRPHIYMRRICERSPPRGGALQRAALSHMRRICHASHMRPPRATMPTIVQSLSSSVFLWGGSHMRRICDAQATCQFGVHCHQPNPHMRMRRICGYDLSSPTIMYFSHFDEPISTSSLVGYGAGCNIFLQGPWASYLAQTSVPQTDFCTSCTETEF